MIFYYRDVAYGPKGDVSSLPTRWPVNGDNASECEHGSDFRFDVRQVVGNPPRGVGVPINERRVARHEISVKP
jgi:hypothetical protein